VALAEEQGKPLNQLELGELQSIESNFGPDILDLFQLNEAMDKRNLVGAPGTTEVKRQLQRWQKILAS
jgi:argininosuccinate lyase